MKILLAPKTFDADDWQLFLEAHDVPPQKVPFLACEMATAIEEAEQWAIERALARMGWNEINAYNREWATNQQDDDVGGWWIRCLSRLFGVKRPLRCAWELGRYHRAARAMVQQAAGVKP